MFVTTLRLRSGDRSLQHEITLRLLSSVFSDSSHIVGDVYLLDCVNCLRWAFGNLGVKVPVFGGSICRTKSRTFMHGDLLVNKDGFRIVYESENETVVLKENLVLSVFRDE